MVNCVTALGSEGEMEVRTAPLPSLPEELRALSVAAH